jgi:hypothetical protein
MARPIEEPIVTEEGPDYRRQTVSRHPAYGQISAGRVSGGTMLYGSDFQHQNFIRIHVKMSELHRGLSNDNPYAKQNIVELDLSEAQWATFVSSLNVGMGVPCTLTQIGAESLPGLPSPPKKTDQFRQEAAEKLERARGFMNDVETMIGNSKLSQKDKAAMIGTLGMAKMNLASNVQFVLDQFSEHMDAVTEKAKIEVNSYVTGLAMRTGIQALAAPTASPHITLESQ